MPESVNTSGILSDVKSGIASLGSGSRGNGTLVRLHDALFLVDCGFTLRQTERRLARLGVRPGELTAILVSHEHSDHISGVAALAHRYALPVFATHGTKRAARAALVANVIRGDRAFDIAGVTIVPVTVPHDAREPTQFVFAKDELRIGVLSDLGQITPHVIEQFADLRGLLLESNHDREMLFAGRYPNSVKQRIGGGHGHLSNEQSAALLAAVAHPELKVVVGHISEENNDPQRLEEAFDGLSERVQSLSFASQAGGHGWLPV